MMEMFAERINPKLLNFKWGFKELYCTILVKL